MAEAARLGDSGSGHDACPPTSASSGSPDVLINGKAAVRLGDSFLPHGCKDHPSHGRALASGATTVLINGRPAGRIGDSIDCGGAVIVGSSDVIIGDDASFDTVDSNKMLAPIYDEQVQAVNRTTGKAISDYAFFIEKSSGETLFGYTDKEGKTPRITTDKEDWFLIYWGDEALAKNSTRETEIIDVQ